MYIIEYEQHLQDRDTGVSKLDILDNFCTIYVPKYCFYRKQVVALYNKQQH